MTQIKPCDWSTRLSLVIWPTRLSLVIWRCDWLTRFMLVILPWLALVEAGSNSVNRFYSTEMYTAKEAMVVYRSVHICMGSFFSVHNTSVQSCQIHDHADLSRKNPFDHASLSNEETRDVKKELDEIDKKFDGAAELNANKRKYCNPTQGSCIDPIQELILRRSPIQVLTQQMLLNFTYWSPTLAFFHSATGTRVS